MFSPPNSRAYVEKTFHLYTLYKLLCTSYSAKALLFHTPKRMSSTIRRK